MECAVSKLSANSKLVKLVKRVLKNAASFGDPRTLKDTDSSFQLFSVIRRLFWILLLHRSRFLSVISVGLVVVSNFLKNVLALLTTLSSLHFCWVTNLVFRVLNWYFTRGMRLSYLFSVFVCKKKELLIPVFICFYCNYNCSNRG